MTFISYAQNYEDVMLWRALKGVEEGFYVDVGAHSPEEGSVTKAFYERGWSGMNIEPNDYLHKELLFHRPRDINLDFAVSDVEGPVIMEIFGDTGLSCIDPDIAKINKLAGWTSESVEVQARRLDTILQDHLSEGQQIHFLKVDVEGHEAAVLKSANLARFRPWVVVIEATLPFSQIETYKAWETDLVNAGYVFVYADGLNRFYVSKESSDLIEAFRFPPNFFDDFVRSSQTQLIAETAVLRDEATVLRDEAAILREEISILRDQASTANFNLTSKNRQNADLKRRVEYMSSRSLWEKLLFRPTGKPKKPLRRALFHKSGRRRGVFKNVIFSSDGQPRKAFAMWMLSEKYQQNDPLALHRSNGGQSEERIDMGQVRRFEGIDVVLSLRERSYLERLRTTFKLGK